MKKSLNYWHFFVITAHCIMFSCIPTKTKTKRGCKIYITPHRIDIRADREANRGFFLKLSSLPYNRLASRLGYFSVVFQSTGKFPFVITSTIQATKSHNMQVLMVSRPRILNNYIIIVYLKCTKKRMDENLFSWNNNCCFPLLVPWIIIITSIFRCSKEKFNTRRNFCLILF